MSELTDAESDYSAAVTAYIDACYARDAAEAAAEAAYISALAAREARDNARDKAHTNALEGDR